MSEPEFSGADDPGHATITRCAASVAETGEIAATLAAWLETGDVVLLHGDLGAGKTTFVKGIATGLGIAGTITSPSFALVNEYQARPGSPFSTVYHIDLYRLFDRAELDSIGFAELVAPEDGVTLVEWPERASGDLPRRFLLVAIDSVGPDARSFRISAHPPDQLWVARFADLQQRLASFS